MRLAILMSNTDESEFAQQHPKDGEKWQALLAPLMPDAEFTVYSVKDGQFPTDESIYDGWIITGSPASVHDVDPWLEALFALIRRIVDRGTPLFGACFGHQAIAMALGGHVAENPGGWVFGTTETEVTSPAPWMTTGPLRQYAAHIEQVVDLPEGAKVVMTNASCPVGGFVIGNHVFTTQYHPEMTHGFIGALIDELADQKPGDVITTARASLNQTAENGRFGRWIVQFLRSTST